MCISLETICLYNQPCYILSIRRGSSQSFPTDNLEGCSIFTPGKCVILVHIRTIIYMTPSWIINELYILHHLFTGSGSAPDRDTFYSIYFIQWSYSSHFKNYRSYKILENFGGFENITPLDVWSFGDIFSNLPHWQVYISYVD